MSSMMRWTWQTLNNTDDLEQSVVVSRANSLSSSTSTVYQGLLQGLGLAPTERAEQAQTHGQTDAPPQKKAEMNLHVYKNLTMLFIFSPILDYPLLNFSLLFVCVICCSGEGKSRAPSLMAESGPLPANRGLQAFTKGQQAFKQPPQTLLSLFSCVLSSLFLSHFLFFRVFQFKLNAVAYI